MSLDLLFSIFDIGRLQKGTHLIRFPVIVKVRVEM